MRWMRTPCWSLQKLGSAGAPARGPSIAVRGGHALARGGSQWPPPAASPAANTPGARCGRAASMPGATAARARRRPGARRRRRRRGRRRSARRPRARAPRRAPRPDGREARAEPEPHARRRLQRASQAPEVERRRARRTARFDERDVDAGAARRPPRRLLADEARRRRWRARTPGRSAARRRERVVQRAQHVHVGAARERRRAGAGRLARRDQQPRRRQRARRSSRTSRRTAASRPVAGTPSTSCDRVLGVPRRRPQGPSRRRAPASSPFESGGRSYGGCGSAHTMRDRAVVAAAAQGLAAALRRPGRRPR